MSINSGPFYSSSFPFHSPNAASSLNIRFISIKALLCPSWFISIFQLIHTTSRSLTTSERTMRFIIITAIIAGCAAAGSLSKQHKHNRRTSTFQIVYNGTEKLKAANNTLYIGSPKQDACCNQFNAEDAATFYLKDEELFLYSPGNPKQQVIVNSKKAATGCEKTFTVCCTLLTILPLGQNSVGYSIGTRKRLEKAQREGWRIDDDDNITFDGLSLMACSSSGVGRDIIVRKSDCRLKGCRACRRVTAKATYTSKPTSCLYSGEGQVVSHFCL